MLDWITTAAPALVGGVLVWASAVKLFARTAPLAARRSALSTVVGKERVVGVYRLVGGVELAVGALLLLPPVYPAEAVAALVLCLGMLGYLGYARIVAPESSCGCLGEKHAPVRWRSFARAGLLVVASGFAVYASDWWVVRPLGTLMVLVIGLAAIVALSPELDRRWLLPLRRLRLRISHPLAGREFDVPLESTVQQLHKSPAYRSVADVLRSDVLESWDEGEWRILTYSASGESGPATAVFAVPRLRYEPDVVKVALV
jgi:hypothetical protein